MNIEQQHSDMVGRLVKPAVDITIGLNLEKVGAIHAILGIAGEVGELADLDNCGEHLLEEAGDLLFYCRDLRRVLGLGEYCYFQRSQQSLAYFAGVAVDCVKKWVVYGQSMDFDRQQTVEYALDRLEGVVQDLLEDHGHTREDALRHNILKLEKGANARYAGGYSDQAAAERRDKQDLGDELSVGLATASGIQCEWAETLTREPASESWGGGLADGYALHNVSSTLVPHSALTRHVADNIQVAMEPKLRRLQVTLPSGQTVQLSADYHGVEGCRRLQFVVFEPELDDPVVMIRFDDRGEIVEILRDRDIYTRDLDCDTTPWEEARGEE